MSFNLLVHNLNQIKFSEDLTQNLLTAPVVPILMKKNSLMGYLLNQKGENDKTKNLLIKVRKQFWHEMDKISDANKKFAPLLILKIKKAPFSKADYDLFEEIILIRCLWFHTFMLDFVKQRHLAYLDFLCNHSLQKREELVQLLRTALFYKMLKDFEIATKMKIPYASLIQLSKSDHLNAKEEQQIENWILQIKNTSHDLLNAFTLEERIENGYAKPAFVHKLLSHLLTFFHECSPSKSEVPDLGRLEDRLEKRGLPFRTTPDPKMIKMRSFFQPGYKLKLENQVYEVEEILSNRENDPNLPIRYGIKDRPDLELIIYINQSQPFLEDFDIRAKHCGVEIYKVIAWQESAVLRERLYKSFNTNLWTSSYEEADVDEDPRISENDWCEIEPILELVKGLLKLPFTPYLTPDGFAYNYYNQLRATKVMLPHKTSYEGLQEFVFKCACGAQNKVSIPIFAHLMHKSGLATIFKPYQDLVKYSLCHNQKMIDLNGSIKEPTLLQTRRNFYYIIEDCQKKTLEKLTIEYPDRPTIKESVDQAILEMHYKLCPGSLLLQNFAAFVEEKARRNLLKVISHSSNSEKKISSFFGNLIAFIG